MARKPEVSYVDYDKNYYETNKEKILARKRAYYIENKHSIAPKKLCYEKEKRASDPEYKLKVLLRQRIGKAIQKDYKFSSAVMALGCSISEFKRFIEQKFRAGMTWNNNTHLGWHLDHIKPLASFDLTDPEQQKEALHFSNYQPLWWDENLSKGARTLDG